MVKKQYYLISYAIIFSALILTSNLSYSMQTQTITNPDSFVSIKLSISNENLDPAVNYEEGGFGINELVLETLVDYYYGDPTRLTGKLAQSVYKSEDGLTYTFKLRQGVKYQDSTEFNAYTMKYSLDRAIIVNDKIGPAWLIQQIIKGGPAIMHENDINVTQAKIYLNAGGVEVVDDYTLKINLIHPYEPFLFILANRVSSAISPYTTIYNRPYNYNTNQSDPYFGMISLTDMFPNLTDWTKLGLSKDDDPAVSGIVPQAGKNDPALYQWYWNRMVGTGPYSIVYHNQNIEVKLKKNVNWWGTFAEGSPDNVILKTINVEEDRISALTNGDADLIAYTPGVVGSLIDLEGNDLVSGVHTYISNTFKTWTPSFNMYDSNPGNFIVPAVDVNTTWNASAIQSKNIIKYQYDPASYASVNNPFTSKLFRKAFIESVNVTKLIGETYYGFASELEGIIPAGMFGHDNSLYEKGFIPRYNYSDAKSLFQFLGWRGTINLPYHVNRLVNKIIFDNFKAEIESMNVGIQLALVPMTDDNYWDLMYAHDLPIYVTGWVPDYADPHNFVFPYFYDGFYPWLTGYSNSNVKNMIEQAMVEQDQLIRKNLYSMIEENTTIDYILMYFSQEEDIFPVRKWNYNVEKSGSLNPISATFNLYWMSKGSSSSEVPSICPLEINVDMATCEEQLTTLTQISSSMTSVTTSANSPAFEITITFIGIIALVQFKRKKI